MLASNSPIATAEAVSAVTDLKFFGGSSSTTDKRGGLDALDLYIRTRDIIFLNAAKDRYFLILISSIIEEHNIAYANIEIAQGLKFF